MSLSPTWNDVMTAAVLILFHTDFFTNLFKPSPMGMIKLWECSMALQLCMSCPEYLKCILHCKKLRTDFEQIDTSIWKIYINTWQMPTELSFSFSRWYGHFCFFQIYLVCKACVPCSGRPDHVQELSCLYSPQPWLVAAEFISLSGPLIGFLHSGKRW